MILLRRHLRFWVTTCLVFQVVSLSALVPRDCCAAHRVATAKQAKDKSCHEEAAAAQAADAEQCPMPGATGAACPMHSAGHDSAPPAAGQRCSMQGTCGVPMAAMFVIISNQGVLTEPLVIARDLRS